MKCREIQDYFGIEKKRSRTKADTIIEVIYEAIYFITRGYRQEVEINNFEEKQFFDGCRQEKH